ASPPCALPIVVRTLCFIQLKALPASRRQGFVFCVLSEQSIAAHLRGMSDTLYHLWQCDHAGDFAAGVRLLVAHCPGAVTSKILSKLQHLAATGRAPDGYMRGKLEAALRGNPTP